MYYTQGFLMDVETMMLITPRLGEYLCHESRLSANSVGSRWFVLLGGRRLTSGNEIMVMAAAGRA